MGPFLIVLAVFVEFYGAQALASNSDLAKFEPSVAFICNKPAMYKTPQGWQKDDDTSCLTDAQAILEYCKKKYPDQDIRNVVEANEYIAIDNWCRKGHRRCNEHHNRHVVRPYRCLLGAFQSDALLVPRHCNFSHEHNPRLCEHFDSWNATATQKCQQRGMHLQTFGMLQPCGVDVFSGVEFVCCPHSVTAPTAPKSSEEEQRMDSDEDSSDYNDDDEDEDEPIIDYSPTTKKPVVQENTKIDLDNDPYMAYLRYSSDPKHSEHERFKEAEKSYLNEHHEKITKMMKEWAEARKHVQDLRESDPKAAETLNREITERFQKMYQAFEQDGAARKRQLVAIHQQRVQAALNEKKRKFMENYIHALQDEHPQPGPIMKSLERYIKAEQKDRIHSINHFEHVRETSPEDARRILPQVKEHLKVIDERVNRSLDMLRRVPQFRSKILTQIGEFRKNYESIDRTVNRVLSQPLPRPKPLPKNEPVEKKAPVEHKPVSPIKLKPAYPRQELPHYRMETTPKPTPRQVEFDPETDEDERTEDIHDQPQEPQAHIGHSQDNSMNIEQKSIFHKNGGNKVSSIHTGSTFGIAIGSCTVFIVIVVAIIVLRKKAHRTPTNTGFVEVEQKSTPEERHVANMQMNGYENPTYKYFEKATC